MAASLRVDAFVESRSAEMGAFEAALAKHEALVSSTEGHKEANFSPQTIGNAKASASTRSQRHLRRRTNAHASYSARRVSEEGAKPGLFRGFLMHFSAISPKLLSGERGRKARETGSTRTSAFAWTLQR
eukprot:scaffold2679_cov251-Pinguiococcus_pyrenoidosus.AAC.11